MSRQFFCGRRDRLHLGGDGGDDRQGGLLRLRESAMLGDMGQVAEETLRLSSELQVILHHEEGQSWQKE